MPSFNISLPQHFIAYRDLYRVQVWGSVRARHGGPLCTLAPLLHVQTCTASAFVPWRSTSDDSTWRTLLSSLLVSFPGVGADERLFPSLWAGAVNHAQLGFPCNLLLLVLLK